MRAAIRQILFSQTPFHPRRLFSAGELGSVHIARDLDTLISTSAGSTPDVALNGYAGKWLDQSGLGNHATQSTSTARPQLSARYNLLTYTEQFDNAAWFTYSANIAANTIDTLDPLGGNTADKLRETTLTAGEHYAQHVAGAFLNGSHVFSVYAKAAERSYCYLNFDSSSTGGTFPGGGYFELTGSGTATNRGASSANIVALSNGWYRCSITSSGTATATPWLATANQVYAGTPAYAATTGHGIYIWGADVRRTTDNQLPYQRVVTATDYDSGGFPQYLAFDADDALVATYPSSLGSACTVCIGRAATTPLILTGQTIGTTYTLNAAVADRVTGLIVVNRALTALETAQVTAYLQARS